MALITSFTQVSQETLTCVIGKRPDLLSGWVYPQDLTPGSTTDTEIRNGLDGWFARGGERGGLTVGEWILQLGCTATELAVVTPTPTPTPGFDLGTFFSGTTGKYVLYGLGGFVLLKMFKILR